MKRNKWLRILSVLLALILVASNLPGGEHVHAAQAEGLCEHHTGHTVECGYAEAVPGQDCTHTHDDGCGYKEAAAEISCTCTDTDESGVVVHTDGCGYTPAVEGAACGHTHDAACGYAEAMEGSVCLYAANGCEECLKQGETGTKEVTSQEMEEPQDVSQETQEETSDGEPSNGSFCICETKCAEDAINSDCPVCSAEGADLSACTGQDAPACTCGTDDPDIHATNCPAYVAPENPACSCAEKCAEDSPNLWCDICGVQGAAACQGEDTAVVYASVTSLTFNFIKIVENSEVKTASGDGWNYDSTTNTLYITADVTGAATTSDTVLISKGGGLNINVASGKTLTLNADRNAVDLAGDSTISGGGTVVLTGGGASNTPLFVRGSLGISNVALTVTSTGDKDVWSYGAITLENVDAQFTGSVQAVNNTTYYPVSISGNSVISINQGQLKASALTLSDSSHLKVWEDSGTWLISAYSNMLPIPVNGGYYRTSSDGEFAVDPDDVTLDAVDDTYFEYVGANHVGEAKQNDDDTTHSKSCTCSLAVVVETGACSGGTATCKDQAVCDLCKQPYGGLSGHTWDTEGVGVCTVCGEQAVVQLTASSSSDPNDIVSYYTDLQAALDEGAALTDRYGRIKLLDNVTGNFTAAGPIGAIDLNGKTITAESADTPALKITDKYDSVHPGIFGGTIQSSGGTALEITRETSDSHNPTFIFGFKGDPFFGPEDAPLHLSGKTAIKASSIVLNLQSGSISATENAVVLSDGATVDFPVATSVDLNGGEADFAIEGAYTDAPLSFDTINMPGTVYTITMDNPGVFAKPGDFAYDFQLETSMFTSAMEGYVVVKDGDDLKLAKGITEGMVTISADATYNGQQQTPTITVAWIDGAPLTAGTDYTVTWDDDTFTNAKTYTATITGINGYTGEVQKTYTIGKADLSAANVTVDGTFTYNGNAKMPDPTVKISLNGTETTLQKGTDYTVSYDDNTDAGAATVTVTGAGNFMGTKDGTFTINPKVLADSDVSGVEDSYLYTGTAIKPTVIVMDGTTKLTEETDYEVVYGNNTTVAEDGTVTITFKGNYSGSVTKTFDITAAASTLTTAPTAVTGLIYTGEDQNLVNAGTASGGTVVYSLTENGTYSSTISTGKDAGDYTVYYKVRGDGNHSDNAGGSVVVTIVPKELTVTGAAATSRDYNNSNTVEITGVTLDGVATGDTVSVNLTGLQGTLSSVNAGTYTSVTLPELTLTGADAENYTLVQPTGAVTTNVTINKLDAEITVGTDTYSKTFGDEAFTLNVTDTNDEANVQYDVTAGADVVSVSNGTVTILKAGDATITVSMPESTNYNAAVSKTITINVAKDSYTVDEINKSYLYSRENADSINIRGLLPTDCGTVTYGTPTTTGTVTYSGNLSVTDGTLSYTVESGNIDATGTITVVVKTQNYEDITITVNIKLIDKYPVYVKDGSEVTLKNNTLTYGEALSKLTFNTAVFVDDDGKEVAGTLAWKEPTATPDAGTRSAAWIFTPSNEEYASVEGTAAITVNKATPVVAAAPTVAERTYDADAALQDGDLTGGNVTGVDGKVLDGSWSWKTSNIVPAVSNSGYVAVFTPTDTTNYNTVERTIPVKVNPKEVTITPDDGQKKIYGTADPAFTYTHNGGTGLAPTGTLGRMAGENAGTYAYTLGTLNAGNNYKLTLASGKVFTIEKAEQAAPTGITLKFTLNPDGETYTATATAKEGVVYSFDGSSYSEGNTKTDCQPNTAYTVYAKFAEKTNYKESPAVTITATSPKLTVKTPEITPNTAGTEGTKFEISQEVTISCATAGATIYYTTDGSDPAASNNSSRQTYSSPFTVTVTTTVRVIAVMTDGSMNDSAEAAAFFVENGDELKTQTVSETFDELPAGLEAAGYTSVDEVINTLAKVVVSEGGSGYSESNTEIYDVKLQFSIDGGKTWIDATPANFPSEGIPVELDYPTGTSAGTHNFKAAHMFTAEVNGYKPGEIEYPNVTEGSKLSFTVKGLSPVTLAWTETSSSGGGTSSGGSSSGSSGSSSTSPYKDGEYDFWMGVKAQIEAAKGGTTLRVSAEDYTRMPIEVMNALKAKDNVTLYITWNGGADISIPSKLAPTPENDRVYYELSELAAVFPAKTTATPMRDTDTDTEEETPASTSPATGDTDAETGEPEGEDITTEEETSEGAAPETEEMIPEETGETKEGCIWHWLMLLFMLACVLFIVIGERKPMKTALIALGVDAVLTVIVMIAGSCSLDIPFAIVTLLVAGASIPVKNVISRENEDEIEE